MYFGGLKRDELAKEILLEVAFSEVYETHDGCQLGLMFKLEASGLTFLLVK